MSLDVKDDYNNYSDNEVDRKRYGIKHGLQSKSTTMLPTKKFSSKSLQVVTKNINLRATQESFKNSEIESQITEK